MSYDQCKYGTNSSSYGAFEQKLFKNTFVAYIMKHPVNTKIIHMSFQVSSLIYIMPLPNIKIVYILNSVLFGVMALTLWTVSIFFLTFFCFDGHLQTNCISCFITYSQNLFSTDQIYFANKLNFNYWNPSSLFQQLVTYQQEPIIYCQAQPKAPASQSPAGG